MHFNYTCITLSWNEILMDLAASQMNFAGTKANTYVKTLDHLFILVTYQNSQDKLCGSHIIKIHSSYKAPFSRNTGLAAQKKPTKQTNALWISLFLFSVFSHKSHLLSKWLAIIVHFWNSVLSKSCQEKTGGIKWSNWWLDEYEHLA